MHLNINKHQNEICMLINGFERPMGKRYTEAFALQNVPNLKRKLIIEDNKGLVN